jgi:hypothetical protein
VGFGEGEDCGMVWPVDLADRVVAGQRVSSAARTSTRELTDIILWPLNPDVWC